MSAPSLWRHRDFLRLWTAQSISVVGDQITLVALPLAAVLTLDASAGQMGLLTAAAWAPHLFVSLFAGAWIDRSSRRRSIMIAADLGRAVVLASVPLAALFDALTIEQLYAVALLLGCLTVLFDQSWTSLFILIVPREQVVEANSKLSTTRAAAAVAGPGAAGGLVRLVTAPGAIVVDAASFIVSALFLRGIKVREPTIEADPTSLRRRIGEGFRWIRRNDLYRVTVLGSSTINFFNFLFGALVILFMSRELGLGPGQIGVIFSAGAVGALVGAPLAPLVARRIGPGPAVVLGAFLFPAPLLLFPLASGPEPVVFVLLIAAEFLASVGVMIFDVNQNSIMSLIVPYRLRGRVSGASRFFNYGTRPLGALAGGALGSTLGLRPALWIGAAGAVLGVLWYLFSPMRTLSEQPPLADDVLSAPQPPEGSR